KTGAVTLGEPVDLNVDFDVKGGPPTVEGAVALAGTVNADLEAQRYTIEGLSLTTDMAGDAVGGGKVNATIVGAVLADLAKQTASVTGLKLDIKTDGAGVPGSTITLSLSGDVATDLAAQAAKVSGLSLNVDATGAAGEGSSVKASLSGDVAADMSQQSATVGGFALDVDAKGGTIPGAGIKANVSGDVAADLANQILTISGLAVNALNLSANGDIKVENYASDLKYTGTLAIDQFNPREVMKALELPPIETADAAALSSVSGNFGLAGSANSVNLSPLNLTLDQTKLTGRLGVANFARAALRFDLKVDGIDADRYLPPAGAPAEAGSPGAAAGEAAKIPVDTLRSLDIDGKATIGKLKIANLNLSQLLATVKAKDGVIRLSPLAAQLYDGSYAGNIGIDASGSTPRLTLNEVVKGVQAGPLLEALQGKEGKILGTADLTAKLTAIGADTDAMKQTADGTIRFDFRNGALRGFNLAETLRQAKAKIGGGTVAASGGPNQTDFSELGGTINLKDGVANNPDFAAKSPFFRVIGNGNANLVSEALDYRTTASVVATTKGQGGEELKELAGVDIPLKVGGTFSNPTYGLDIEGLAKSLAQSKAKELLDGKADKAVSKAKEEVTKKLTEKIGKEAAGKVVDDKVKDAVGGALKGLFN
ncbi:MAG: AsmA family protein, partial [Pseudomonadota bacterium]